MAELLEKCAICGALVDEEDLFCANCGTEAPNHAEKQSADVTGTSTYNFQCSGCGASMSYDASARTLRCPFCGSEKLEEQRDAKALTAQRIVPFTITHEQAVAVMRRELGSSFWRPGDLAQAATVTTMAAVYVPYWVFTARTFTYWTADTSQTPPGARSDWYPLSGDHRNSYSGLLIGASSALTPGESAALCPFDLGTGLPPGEMDTENMIVEQFRVQRKYARPLAHQGIEELERQTCVRYVPGRVRNLKVNVRIEGLSSEPILVPVWIMAYRYRDQLFRFLVNGQTGKATGQAPISRTKIVGVIAIVVLAIVAILVGFALCAGVAQLSARPAFDRDRASRVVPASGILAADVNTRSPSANDDGSRTHSFRQAG